MRMPTGRLAAGLALALALGGLAGCAPRGTDLVKAGTARVEVEPSEAVEIFWTRAVQHGPDLIVSGRVRARDPIYYPLWGHVDVAVMAPDGSLLRRARSSVVFLDHPRRSVRWIDQSDFTARFPVVVPEGSVVRLRFRGSDRSHTKRP